MSSFQRRPEGASPVTSVILDVLGAYTMFPWPLLKTQAERHGLNGAQLTLEQVRVIAVDVEAALARFTSPEKAKAAMADLWSALR